MANQGKFAAIARSWPLLDACYSGLARCGNAVAKHLLAFHGTERGVAGDSDDPVIVITTYSFGLPTKGLLRVFCCRRPL